MRNRFALTPCKPPALHWEHHDGCMYRVWPSTWQPASAVIMNKADFLALRCMMVALHVEISEMVDAQAIHVVDAVAV